MGRSKLICQSPLKCAGSHSKWRSLSINIKYLYLTPSSTSQIAILLDESKVEELTGWLTVNNGEIVPVDKPRKKNSTPDKFFSFQGIIFTTGL